VAGFGGWRALGLIGGGLRLGIRPLAQRLSRGMRVSSRLCRGDNTESLRGPHPSSAAGTAFLRALAPPVSTAGIDRFRPCQRPIMDGKYHLALTLSYGRFEPNLDKDTVILSGGPS
jgi:hypothetical protein